MGNFCWRSQGAKTIARDSSQIQQGLDRKRLDYENLQNANFHMAAEMKRLFQENKVLHAARIQILVGKHRSNSRKALALMKEIKDESRLLELSEIQQQVTNPSEAAPKQRLLRTLETENDNMDSDTEFVSEDIDNLYAEMASPAEAAAARLDSDAYLRELLQQPPEQQLPPANEPALTLDAALERVRPLPPPPPIHLPLAPEQEKEEEEEEPQGDLLTTA